jgi:hypothetical protein
MEVVTKNSIQPAVSQIAWETASLNLRFEVFKILWVHFYLWKVEGREADGKPLNQRH